MIISHAPNERYRKGWDRIFNNIDDKESVMEYTDCDNCAFLEAQNNDLEVQIEEYEEENGHLRELLRQIIDIAADE